LGCGLSDLNYNFKKPGVQKWFAERNFCKANLPIMWLCWNDDCCFSIHSNSMSYLDTKDNNNNTCLSMLNDMRHSHYNGYTPQESYWFANEILSGNKIPDVKAEYSGGQVKYFCSAKIKGVKLFYITERMSYVKRVKYNNDNTFMAQDWKIVDLDPAVDTAVLPPDAVGKYIEFTLENGIVLTTAYNE